MRCPNSTASDPPGVAALPVVMRLRIFMADGRREAVVTPTEDGRAMPLGEYDLVVTHGVAPTVPALLSNDEIHALFYPMGTATENQLQIARAIGRAIECRVLRAAGVPGNQNSCSKSSSTSPDTPGVGVVPGETFRPKDADGAPK